MRLSMYLVMPGMLSRTKQLHPSLAVEPDLRLPTAKEPVSVGYKE